MASEAELSRLQDVLEYSFKDIALLKQALTAADRNREHPDVHHDGNRGLALSENTLSDLRYLIWHSLSGHHDVRS